jgi:poly [ADP-ribose] polymerase
MKGKIPIDDHFPLNKADYHVLEYMGKVYSATLNQTNVTNNNNKFYIIQVLQNDSNQNCYFFTRWGRVGVPGQFSNQGGLSVPAAISLYNSKLH